MKKIYFEPQMRIKMFDFQTSVLEASLDDGNPSDLPGGGGKDPGDDSGEDWGGAKERNPWDSNGLW